MTFVLQEQPPDLVKVLGEWALAAGRSLQSEQTGFVHYYYQVSSNPYQTIPLLENTYFILALFRSCLVEHIQEAKTLLKRLLEFQNLKKNESRGNFPVYLHEYPECFKPSLCLQLLPPFLWIIKQFGHILGSDLRQRLEDAIDLSLEYSLGFHKVKAFPYPLAVRLAAAQFACGKLWGQDFRQQTGESLLNQLAERQLTGWETTAQLGDLLASLQMAYPSLLQSPWHKLWHYLEQTWHVQTGCYIGPCVGECQAGLEPQPNLYDLYAGYFSGQFSRRASLCQPYHLQAVLIKPSLDKFSKNFHPFVEGKIRNQAWQTINRQSWAYSILEKKEEVLKTYTPFRFIWGDLHLAHSFVCQGGVFEKVEFEREDQALKFYFFLSNEFIEEDSDKKREIEFFIDFHPDIHFSLGDKPATTFELGQTLKIDCGPHPLLMTCQLLKGEGVFRGHLMRSNRPSQVNIKGENRFQAYDWTFFLRTVRRKGPCCILIKLCF